MSKYRDKKDAETPARDPVAATSRPLRHVYEERKAAYDKAVAAWEKLRDEADKAFEAMDQAWCSCDDAWIDLCRSNEDMEGVAFWGCDLEWSREEWQEKGDCDV